MPRFCPVWPVSPQSERTTCQSRVDQPRPSGFFKRWCSRSLRRAVVSPRLLIHHVSSNGLVICSATTTMMCARWCFFIVAERCQTPLKVSDQLQHPVPDTRIEQLAIKALGQTAMHSVPVMEPWIRGLTRLGNAHANRTGRTNVHCSVVFRRLLRRRVYCALPLHWFSRPQVSKVCCCTVCAGKYTAISSVFMDMRTCFGSGNGGSGRGTVRPKINSALIPASQKSNSNHVNN